MGGYTNTFFGEADFKYFSGNTASRTPTTKTVCVFPTFSLFQLLACLVTLQIQNPWSKHTYATLQSAHEL